jgi:hypothetical protein|tara:strand:- start:1090 stop:1653 length:564 start_codon:yes stop_codon:yes gene_type:complete
MKSFTDYLTESKRVYAFKVGIAGDLPENCEDDMERCLQKFGVSKMSAGKKTPIQERPLDFPQLENCEVHYYEIELMYPTTSQILQEYIGHCCGVNQAHIIVRNPNEPQELYQQEKDETQYVAKLTQEDMGQAEGDAQANVGPGRVMDLLKELETARKERSADYVGDVPVGESKDIGDSQNTKSPIGA